MKENLINAHLDKCIMGDSHTPVDDTSSPTPQIAPPGTIAYTQRKPSTQKDRLPFINYSLLTDHALRKKLRDLGIPNHGSKELMRRRHTEWVNLWNANCDSRNPVSKRQLLQELRVWEDTLGRQSDKTGTSGFMAKDFDRDHHVKIQKSNFDELIMQAREKRAIASNKPPPTTEEGTSLSSERGDPAANQVQEHTKLSQLQNGGSVTEQHFGGSSPAALPSISQSPALPAAVVVDTIDQKDPGERQRLVPAMESSKDTVLRSDAEGG
jgi:E3 ubiquitin-protein ligase RAD18